MKLSEVSFNDIIPSNMRSDKNIKGFIAAFDYMKNKVLQKSQMVDLMNHLDLLTDDQLHQVAKAIDIPWYDTSRTRENRINTIKNYMDIYQKSGTVYALQEALSNVFDSAQVIEWYQSGGTPYTFTVYVSGTVSDDAVRVAVETMRRIKPAHSVLAGIYFIEGVKSPFYIGGIARTNRRNIVISAPTWEE